MGYVGSLLDVKIGTEKEERVRVVFPSHRYIRLTQLEDTNLDEASPYRHPQALRSKWSSCGSFGTRNKERKKGREERKNEWRLPRERFSLKRKRSVSPIES